MTGRNPDERFALVQRRCARLLFLAGMVLIAVIPLLATGALYDAFLALADFTLRHGG